MRKWAILLLPFVSLLVTERSYASHAMGTDITYRCLGNSQYEVTVAFYRDCSGIPAPSSISIKFFSASCNISSTNAYTHTLLLQNALSREVSPLCPDDLPNSSCNGGPLPGVERYVFMDTILLPRSCSDWIVGYSECCRNSNITNLVSAAGYDLYAYAVINNTSGICNNSPVFTTLPVPYICATKTFNYNHGAVDPDGDTLKYQMIQPNDDYLVPIPYDGIFSVNYPLSTTTSTFQFDSATGQMSFTPDIQQNAVVTIQVKEYRNGVLVGSTMRDIQIVVLESSLCTNDPPVVPDRVAGIVGGGLLDSSTIQMCPGTPLSFQVVVSDVNGDSVYMTSNAQTAIPGSNFTVTTGDSFSTGRFAWTPTVADTGFHAFQVTYSDNGCPVSTPQTITYVIFVFDRVTASADQVYCGDSIQLHAYGGSVFTWTPSAGLSATNIPDPKAAPATSTMYYVTSDCNRTDSVIVDVQPPYTLNAGRDTTICLNAIAQLNATVSPTSYGPYTYSWSPPAGLQNLPTISNPKTKPEMTTTYVVTTFSAQGCMRQDDVTVFISGVAPSINATADPAKVCVGETTQLELSIRPSSCGTTAVPCDNTPVDYIIGNGSQESSSVSFPCTPYKGSVEDERVQYLYRYSELNAMGIYGGTITKIAFYVSRKRSTIPLNNFTIKLGCTPVAFLSDFEPNVTAVYGPTAYSTSAGWNTHVLSSPYDWDGVSNLIVQVCYDNNQLFNSSDDEVMFTLTPFSAVAYGYENLASGCSLFDSDTVKFRPNTKLTVCAPAITNAVIAWNLDTADIGKSVISNPSVSNPTAQVFGTSTYVVNFSRGGCAGQDPVTIEVDTTFEVNAVPDTSLCRPNPIQLNAVTSGQPSPIYLTCGTNGTPATTPVNYQIGTSPGLLPRPTPYQGDYHDSRIQMLFKRSELEAVSMKRGVITSIAFNVAFKKSTAPFRDFTIKMGCTDLELLGSSFQPGLQMVFNPKNVTTIQGWNIHAFDNYFDWDGFSNIIVEVCFNNIGYALEDIISYTPTSFISVVDTAEDFEIGCSLPTPRKGGSYSRPNVIFGVSPPPPSKFSYSWSPAAALSNDTAQSPVANPVATTTYAVTLTDGICVSTDSLNVNFYASFDVNVYGTNVGCNGSFDGNAVSVPVGGVTPYQFSWSTGQTNSGVPTDTLYNLYAGIYKITVIDNNGCDASDSVTITVPAPLIISNIDVRNASCFEGDNGTALATGQGGTTPYGFAWSSGDDDSLATQLSAGSYGVTLTDRSGCMATDTAVVSEPSEILSSVTANNASCYKFSDGGAAVSASGGTPPYQYAWSDSQSSPAASGLRAGIYTVTITDDSNCIRVDTAIVSQPDSFTIMITAVDVSCFGGTDGSASAAVLDTASNTMDSVNYSFRWETVPPVTIPAITGLAAGPIELIVTDTFGCPISTIVVIGSPEKIIISSSSDGVSCFGNADGRAVVMVDSGGTPPFQYEWNNSVTDSNIAGLTAGMYYVTVNDDNDCREYDTVFVSEPLPITFEDSVINLLCHDGNDGRIIPVNISGGTPSFSWLWSDGQTTPIADNLPAGTYSVTVTDRNGCRDSLTGILVIEPMEILFDNIVITPPCYGKPSGVIVVSSGGGMPPHQFAIDSLAAQSNPTFSGIAAGYHNLVVTDNNGCTVDTSVLVIPYDTIHVAFDTPVVAINLGQDTTLNPVVTPYDPGYSISWEPSSGLSCSNCLNPVANPVAPTLYQMTVIDGNNCSYTENILVNVSNNLILVVPNAFSPNGDGFNDILYVYGISVSSVILQVYDRWGEKVFESRNKDTGWDGLFKGRVMPPDVYVYYAEAVFEDGQKKQIKGSTTILK